MALILADRVKESTTTTGTSDFALGGAVTGFQTFADGVGVSNTTYYAVSQGSDWEVGLGTLSSDGLTLARTTVFQSSNSDTKVSFASGSKEVFVTYAADKAVFEDASGNVTLPANLTVTGGSTTDSVQLDLTAGVTPAVGQIAWDANQGTASLGLLGGNVISRMGQSLVAYVTNAESVTITKGQAVYLFSAQGDRATVKLANNTGDATSAKTLGIVAEDITANGTGFVVCQGVVYGLDLSAFTAGDTIYLGATAGALTATKPYAPNHLVYLGVVEKANAGAGQLYVRVQNGYELDEIHNVSAQSPSNGQTIVYNSSTSLWEKNTVSLTAGVNGTLPVANGGTGITSFGTGVATFLGTPSSANLAAAVTDETGSGALVFANSPTLVTPALGTPASGIATNLTGLPLSTGVTGTLPIANGGTGLTTTPANGALDIGNGTGFTRTTLTAGTGISVTNGSGSITIANTASVSAATPTALGTVYAKTNNATAFETFLGYQAGNVSTGVNNTFVGYQAGLSTTTGVDNTAVGFKALDVNTVGYGNVAIGSDALGSNTTGRNSVAVGYRALYVNTTGFNNNAVGANSLVANTTGQRNNAFGYGVLQTNTSGSDNIAFGDNALQTNSTGTNNIGIGSTALLANTTGTNNTAVGYAALTANTTGTDNVAVGFQALDANTTGIANIAIGRDALTTSTTTLGNVAVGAYALRFTTTGTSNSGVGYQALTSNTTGGENTSFGYRSGRQITTGSQNTLIGSNAGFSGTNDLTTGSNNIIIGYIAEASSATVSNEVTLGNTSIVSTRLRGVVEFNMALFEQATVSATAATGTIAYYARSQSVLYYTSNASANWTVNLTGASGVTLNSIMQTGQSMTVAFLVTQGSTAYYNSAVQVDGASVTPKWQGGTAPTAGNASSVDTYVYTVIKTGSATFTVLASQTKFA